MCPPLSEPLSFFFALLLAKMNFTFHLGFSLHALPTTLHPLPNLLLYPFTPSLHLSSPLVSSFFLFLLLSLYSFPHLIYIQPREFTCKLFYEQSFNKAPYIRILQPLLAVYVIKCQMHVIKIDKMCTFALALLSARCNVICYTLYVIIWKQLWLEAAAFLCQLVELCKIHVK